MVTEEILAESTQRNYTIRIARINKYGFNGFRHEIIGENAIWAVHSKFQGVTLTSVRGLI